MVWLRRAERTQGNSLSARRSVLAPTALFDSVEEPLDLVAGAIEVRAEADRIAAVALRWNVRPGTLLHCKLSDPVGVITTVASNIDPDFRRDSSFPASRTSWASPGLSASRAGRPLLSTNAWILLVKPPRDRPIDRSLFFVMQDPC